MLAAFLSLIPIFLLILLGFALRKGGFVPREQWRGVEQICYWLLFPALLILSLVRAELSIGSLRGYVYGLFAMIVAMTVLMWLLRVPLRRWLDMRGPTYSSLFQTVTRWNGFIAMAIIDKLYGEPGVTILAIAFAVMIPYLNVVNILVLATYAGRARATPRMILLAMVKNPLILAVLTGLAVNLLRIPLPSPLMTTLELLGRGALGMTLLALGAGLQWRAVKAAGPEIGLSIGLRLLGMPAIALGCGLLFGVTGTPLVIMVIAAAVPTAVNGYVLARAMGGDAEYYAAAATAQVMLSFVTLPVIIWLAMRIAG